MTVVHEREPVTGVLRAMAADVDVCEELVRAARGRSPELARLGEAETLSHVNALIGAAEAWLTTLGRVEEHDFAAALLLGADRAAQGIPMTAVLRGVQAALTRVVEITVERSRSAGVSDTALLTVVLRLKEYGDALERHVVNGYRAAESGTPRGAGEARGRLLRRLLTESDDTSAPSRAELAREGVRTDGRYHCVVADPGDAAHARALAARLSALPGVFGVVDDRPVGLCPRLPRNDELAELGRDGVTLVVASPLATPQRLRPLYRLCVRGLEIGSRRGLRGVRELTDLAGEIAMADHAVLGAALSARFLGGLDPADDFHRQLALTAMAFLDSGRRLDRTATALFTHPNTVRYRLGRLHHLTGTSLTDGSLDGPSGTLTTLHWWWALTTWLATGTESAPIP
ncbi:PucR family transcriptional regulator [Streptomyces europaeiscabiei]|uniref:PucR family transcriptional regulator n=1 Tax=Streptomyces europaeiscabiei TaxID=146819 RepID=UPI0029A89853|nr:helix-turn-helix domain-containing protein [Streptomyces europaeiscabiei]MDX3664587.1 helix-turn-helix domain-containing protein [Streptomyces europaeiscabiei]